MSIHKAGASGKRKAPLVVVCGVAVATVGAISALVFACEKLVNRVRGLLDAVNRIPGLEKVSALETALFLVGVLVAVGLVALLPKWMERQRALALQLHQDEARLLLAAAEKSHVFRIGPIPAPLNEDVLIKFERADGRHHEIHRWILDSRLPLLYVSGHSGSGKSSLMQAFVVPMLNRGNPDKDHEPAAVAVMMRAFGNINQTVRHAIGEKGIVWKVPPELDGLTARQVFEKASERLSESHRRLVVVFDQFEEILAGIESTKHLNDPAVELVRSLQVQPIVGVCCVLVARAEYGDAYVKLGLPPREEGATLQDVPAFSLSEAAKFLAARLQDRRASKIETDTLAMTLARQAESLVDLPGRVTPIALNMIGQMYIQDPVIGARLSEPDVRAVEGVLAAYVRSRVEAGDLREAGPKVLNELVTREGRRRQPSPVGSLAAATALASGAVETALLTLARDGLVRPVGECWEIAHDFLAPLLRIVVDRIAGSIRRRLRPWLPVAFGAMLVAGLIGIWGWAQAKREATISLATQLGTQAELLGSRERASLDTSLLLSIESLSKYRTLAADIAVRRGLGLLAVPTDYIKTRTPITGLAKSNDDSLLATVESNNLVSIWSLSTGTLVREIQLPSLTGGVQIVGKDRLIAITQSNPTKVMVWSLSDGKEIATCSPDSNTSSFSTSLDGRWFATTGAVTNVQIWSADDGKQVCSLPQYFINKPGANSAVGIEACFVPSSDFCATNDVLGGDLIFWDIRTGKEHSRIKGDGFRGIEFSPDGKLFVGGFENFSFGIWDVGTGQLLHAYKSGDLADTMAYSSNGRVIALVEGTYVLILDGEDFKVRSIVITGDEGSAVYLSPQGDRFLEESGGVLSVWDVATKRELSRVNTHSKRRFLTNGDFSSLFVADGTATLRKFTCSPSNIYQSMRRGYRVTKVMFSSDGHYVASASDGDNIVSVRDSKIGNELFRLSASGSVATIAFNPSSTLIAAAAAGPDKSSSAVYLWRLSDGKKMAVLAHSGIVHSIAFGSDGKLVATTCSDGIVRLWSTESGSELQRFHIGDSSDFSSVAIVGSTGLLATSSILNSQVWDIENGKMKTVLNPGGGFMGLQISRDARYLLTTGPDPKHDANQLEANKSELAVVWNCSNWKKVSEMAYDNTIEAGAFSPDGELVATGGFDGIVKVWRASTGVPVARFDLFGMIRDLTFTPDNRTLIVACVDGTARIFDVEGGREIGRILHDDAVSCVAADPIGRLIATGCFDGTIRLSLFQTEDLIRAAQTRVTRKLTRNEWKMYSGEHAYKADLAP